MKLLSHVPQWLYLGCIGFLSCHQPRPAEHMAGPPPAPAAPPVKAAPVVPAPSSRGPASPSVGCLSAEWCIETAPREFLDPKRVFAFNAGHDVWAVGPLGQALQRNGEQWTAIDCGTWADLNAAWSSAANDVWFFGSKGTIARWDGQRCTPVNSGTDVDLHRAWGSGARDLWAVGSANTVVHWDGARWAATRLRGSVPGHDQGKKELLLTGSGPSDVWVLDRGVLGSLLDGQSLWHWNGVDWQLVPVRLAKRKGQNSMTLRLMSLTDLVASAPGDLWLAGILNPSHDGSSAVVLRGGPSHWRPVHSLPQDKEESMGDLHVYANGPRNVYLHARGGNEGDCSPFERCAQWDGKRWTDDDACAVNSWQPGGWFIGEEEEIRHWDGQQTQVIRPRIGFAPTALWPGSRGELYLLGTQKGERDETESVLLRWDGHLWQPRLPIADRRLNALWGSGDELWAVGQKGAIWHFDGHAWEDVGSDDGHDLYALWGSSPRDLWAAGDAGTILHFRGKEWVAEDSGKSADLRALWGSGPGDVWAAGRAGTLLHFEGSKFLPVVSGTTANLAVIDGSGANEVWIGGDSGTLLHWTGSGLQPVVIEGSLPPSLGPVPGDGGHRSTTQRLGIAILALKSRGPQELWVAGDVSGDSTGDRSALWRWNGSVWSPVAYAVSVDWHPKLTALTGTNDLWALGPQAGLYHYRPAPYRH